MNQSKSFEEKLTEYVGEYCFGEVCVWMKGSGEYHRCKLMDESKCQLWQFLKWANTEKKEEE